MKKSNLLTSCIIFMIIIATNQISAGNAFAVRNADFKQLKNGTLKDWNVSVQSARVIPERIGGKWYPITISFNSGKYKCVRLDLYVAAGANGSLWIDNFQSTPKLNIINPSFEKGRSLGWSTKYGEKSDLISFDNNFASEGKKSFLIYYKAAEPFCTRLKQDIKVKPNTDYRITFDCYVGDDFLGAFRPNVYAILANGTIGSHIKGPTYSTDNIIYERGRHPSRVAIKLNGGKAELSQVVDVTSGKTFELAMDVMTKELEGELKVVVEDEKTGAILGKKTESSNKSSWHKIKIRFQPSSTKVKVRLTGSGKGEIKFAEVQSGFPILMPPVQKISWLEASENFQIPSRLSVSTKGKSGPKIKKALEILERKLGKLGISVEAVKQKTAQLNIDISPEYVISDKGKESYSLSVDPEGVSIKAGDEAGAFYGIMTLLQMIYKKKNNTIMVLAANIKDYPDMPMRAVLLWGRGGKLLDEICQNPEILAHYKFNTAIISLNTYTYRTDPKSRKQIQTFLDKCRGLNVEVIPAQCTLDHSYYVLSKNPNLVEGKWVKNEKIKLVGETPVELKYRNILRTKKTNIVLKDSYGYRTYKPGIDYRVIPGETKYKNDKFSPDAKPFAIVRLEGGKIPDGATVCASYDYVDLINRNRFSYCTAEPEVNKIMGDWMTNLAKDWPFRYNFIAMDELYDGRFYTDSRSRRSGKSASKLLAGHLNFLNKKAHKGKKNFRLMMWADMVDPHDRAAQIGVKNIGPMLPKDIIQVIWGYTANVPENRGIKSVNHFSKLGISTLVCGWYDFTTIHQWVQVIRKAREKGLPCLGYLCSMWNKREEGFEEAAICSWRIPRKGEKRFKEIK